MSVIRGINKTQLDLCSIMSYSISLVLNPVQGNYRYVAVLMKYSFLLFFLKQWSVVSCDIEGETVGRYFGNLRFKKVYTVTFGKEESNEWIGTLTRTANVYNRYNKYYKYIYVWIRFVSFLNKNRLYIKTMFLT